MPSLEKYGENIGRSLKFMYYIKQNYDCGVVEKFEWIERLGLSSCSKISSMITLQCNVQCTLGLFKDYYIDGRNTRICQLQLGEDFKL